MIINIRGTGGSGKTTIVRAVMDAYGVTDEMRMRYAVTEEGRRRPVGYVIPHPSIGSSLFVAGHYEIECGGCDTIKTLDILYTMLREQIAAGHDVLYEGIMASEDVTRAVTLNKENPIHVIVLTTTLDDCLAAINERRVRNGKSDPVNPRRTSDRYRAVARAGQRLKSAGVSVERLDRDAARDRVINLLLHGETL